MSSHSTPTIISLKGDQQALVLEWSDGHKARIAWHVLRSRCPCATCRSKRAEPPAAAPSPLTILTPQEAAPTRAIAMHPVGNYAYQIEFSDGHNTGIYSLELLREIGGSAE